MGMSKADLLVVLRERATGLKDAEADHVKADEALLAYIDDPEISEAFEAIDKWYAWLGKGKRK